MVIMIFEKNPCVLWLSNAAILTMKRRRSNGGIRSTIQRVIVQTHTDHRNNVIKTIHVRFCGMYLTMTVACLNACNV